MTARRAHRLRAVTIAMALLMALLSAAPVRADDAELLRMLPGEWTFTAWMDEEGTEKAFAYLALEQDGALSLRCCGPEGETLRTLGGAWAFEYVPDGMDRLTLRFTPADDPAQTEAGSGVTCVYTAYAESWEEGSTLQTYLVLESPECTGVSPFVEFYGDAGQDPVGLSREQGPNMRIGNCKSFVSLRAKRSASSARLAKVPLGAAVLAFPEEGDANGFIRCLYDGQNGFIKSEYLVPLE